MVNSKNLRTLGLVLAGLMMVALLQKLNPETSSVQAFTLTVQGRERNYFAYAPKDFNKTQNPLPAVIILHGGGGPMGSAQMMADASGWPQKAMKEKFLAVFPNGTLRNPQKPIELKGNIQEWSDGSGRSKAEQTGVDDVSFINASLDDLQAKFPVDPQRIYVTGFSNGASMTFRIGVELADRIAAIAPVAGILSVEPSSASSAVSLLYISGSEDKRPESLSEKESPSSKNQIVVWAEALGCPGKAEISTKDMKVRTIRYGSCRDNSEVVTYTVQGMGHVYPGAQTELWEQGADNPANDVLNATDAIWDFFKQHKKP